jgi:hypothetical protein
MMTTDGDNAANRYAARVDAVLMQRTRLRGREPRETSSRVCQAITR